VTTLVWSLAGAAPMSKTYDGDFMVLLCIKVLSILLYVDGLFENPMTKQLMGFESYV
jgi:hypothetical protein